MQRPGRGGQLVFEFGGGNEINVFFDEIETRLDIGQQIEQRVTNLRQRTADSARELRQGRCQFVLALGIDDAEHRFSLREVQAASQKRAGGARRQAPPAALPVGTTPRSAKSNSGGEPIVCNSASGSRV